MFWTVRRTRAGLWPALAVLAATAALRGACAAAPGGAEAAAPPGAAPEAAAGECLAGAGEACQEEYLEGDEESLVASGRTELLQRGLQLRAHSAATARDAAPAGAGGAAAAAAEAPRGAGGDIDCAAHPMFCSAKLRCAQEPLSDAEKVELSARLASPDGHANLRSWCAGYPLYATSVQKCIVEEDPQGYARTMYESQRQLNLLDADAAYCFAVGHCNNTAMASNASLLEAEGECDRQFGHEAWTSIGYGQMEKVMRVAFAFERGEVNMSAATEADKLAMIRNLSAVSAMTACAMGNFQCDVAYCRQNYCDDGKYRSRFGELAWAP